jgi:hypothetical protein
MASRGSFAWAARALTLAIMVSLGACGDDDGGDGGGEAGDGESGSGGGGAGMAGGTGGSGGRAGAGAGGGGAGTGGAGGMPASIECGGETCNAVMSVMGALPPCCDDDSGGICGATVGMAGECEGVGQPGMDDSDCPSEMSVAMTMLPGCCTPDDKCGVRSATLMGCVERTDYPTTFLMSGEQLDEVDCDGGGGDTDGGT